MDDKTSGQGSNQGMGSSGGGAHQQGQGAHGGGGTGSGGYDRGKVEEIRNRLEQVDGNTAIEIGRMALQRAKTSGASFEQVKPLLNEFGNDREWSGSGR